MVCLLAASMLFLSASSLLFLTIYALQDVASFFLEIRNYFLYKLAKMISCDK